MTAPITAPRGILLLAELADDVDDAAEAEADSRIGVDEEEIGMGGGFETGGIASEAFGAAVSTARVPLGRGALARASVLIVERSDDDEGFGEGGPKSVGGVLANEGEED